MSGVNRKSILLNVVLIVAVALTIGIIGVNIKTAVIPPLQYRQIDVEKVLKAIKKARLVPLEAKYYEVLHN